MGQKRKARGRDISGLLVLDKSPGYTSNQALQIVKKIYGASKLGHTGSLDPLATGVLPLCFGHATKFSQFLLDSDKGYRVVIKLGEKTSTGDSDGEVIQSSLTSAISLEHIQEGILNFRGSIEQIPPMYSAIKHKGQPLYKLAREGVTIERKPRQVTIYSINIDSFDKDLDELTLTIFCSKGTYIRSIADDLGDWLGCGAHVQELNRIQAGPYLLSQSFTIEKLVSIRNEGGHKALDSILLPVSSAVSQLPTVSLEKTLAYYVKKGQAVLIPHAPTSGLVQLVEEDIEDNHQPDINQRFLGVGEILDDGRVAPRRLIINNL